MRGRVGDEWFSEAEIEEALGAVRNINPVMAHCIEGSIRFEEEDDD